MSAPKPTDYAACADIVAKWKRPLLLTHAKPDGDALGALAAMRAVLRLGGADPVALLYDPNSSRYAMFDSYAPMRRWGVDWHAADMTAIDGILILDTCTYNQLAPIADWLRSSTLPKMVVDHHVTRDDLADAYLIDEHAAATCLILHDWFDRQGWRIARGTAEALYVGIAMDTGWFRHSNTDARVLAAAADLVTRGAVPHELFEQLFQRESEGRVRVLGAALSSLELLADGRLAVMTLTKDRLAQVGATAADTEDVVNEPLRMASVIVSVLLVEGDGDLVRVSLRSKPPPAESSPAQGAPDRDDSSTACVDVDVAKIAQTLGGGGHRRASGVRIADSVTRARGRVIDAINAAWEGTKGSRDLGT